LKIRKKSVGLTETRQREILKEHGKTDQFLSRYEFSEERKSEINGRIVIHSRACHAVLHISIRKPCTGRPEAKQFGLGFFAL